MHATTLHELNLLISKSIKTEFVFLTRFEGARNHTVVSFVQSDFAGHWSSKQCELSAKNSNQKKKAKVSTKRGSALRTVPCLNESTLSHWLW
jgi:hypothetical protein